MLTESNRVSFGVKFLFVFSILLCFRCWNSRIDLQVPDLKGPFIRIVTYGLLRFQIYPEVLETFWATQYPSINPSFLRSICFKSNFTFVTPLLPFLSCAVSPMQKPFRIQHEGDPNTWNLSSGGLSIR